MVSPIPAAGLLRRLGAAGLCEFNRRWTRRGERKRPHHTTELLGFTDSGICASTNTAAVRRHSDCSGTYIVKPQEYWRKYGQRQA